ncbi:MAG: hypothetical protein K2O45_18615 [Oscillospiraceae bacterium]|nr:hypothetical protein [Oscillospiraceae bacterium]
MSNLSLSALAAIPRHAQQMRLNKPEGIKLTGIGKTVQTPDGEARQVFYREGDPEFEAYIAELEEVVLPRNFMSFGVGKDGTSGPQMARRISSTFDQYYAGTADEKTIEGVLSDVVENLRSAYVERGFDPDEFMPKLLRDVYDVARLDNIHGAGNQSWKDSRQLAALYNGSDRNSNDVIYYDAKYYYQSEEMKTTLQEITRRIGRRYGVSQLDLPTSYPAGSIQQGLYSSYNTIINDNARNSTLNGNMVDETMVPPEGFRFFYKGNDAGMNRYPSSLPSDGTPESTFDGILHVWYGDWSYTGRVPVRQDPTRFPISVNMYDTVAGSGAKIPSQIVSALKNFDFFTMIQSGRYTPSHPRNLPT